MTYLVIRFPGSYNPAGFRDTPHLPQHTDRVLDMLQDLVARDDIKRIIRIRELIAIDLLERRIRQAARRRILLGLLQHRLDRVAADDLALRHQLRQVRRDRAGSTAEIED